MTRAGEPYKIGSEEELSTRIPVTSAVGPVCPRETEEMEDENKESCHDANEDRWETACEEVEYGAEAEKEEMRTDAEGSGIGSQPDRGPN